VRFENGCWTVAGLYGSHVRLVGDAGQAQVLG
jgi:hypothetical protein